MKKSLLISGILLIALAGVCSADVNLTASLYAYYTGDTNGTFSDYLGVKNATSISATFTNSGKINGAYSFDSGPIVMGNDVFDTIGTTGSLNIWIKRGYLASTGRPFDFQGVLWAGVDPSVGTTFLYDANPDPNPSFIRPISDIPIGTWVMYTVVWNTSRLAVYLNGTLVNVSANVNSIDWSASGSHRFGTDYTGGQNFNGTLDEIGLWSKQLNDSEITSLFNQGLGRSILPTISIIQSTYNVTKTTGNGTVWRYDTSYPVTVHDPTPTVKFFTSLQANCSISKSNVSYTAMVANDSNTKCTTEDTTDMTCTLPTSQALAIGNQFIFISCKGAPSETTASTSGPLSITLSAASESEARTAIDAGIRNRLSSPAIYTDQQVYVRRVNGTQQLATFDRVAVFGNKRWAFNYISSGETYASMGNLTPVLYVYEFANISSGTIQSTVENLIQNTI